MEPAATVSIQDEVRVDPQSGDAVCSRTYTFANRGSFDIAFPSPLRVGLDVEAQVTGLWLQDKDALDQTDVDHGSYETTLRFLGSVEAIQPGESIRVTIAYRWPRFLPPASEATYKKAIRVRHPFGFIYELHVKCSDPQFLATPAFKITPDNCRPAPPFFEKSSDNQAFYVRTAEVAPNTLLAITISGGHGSLSLPVLTQLGDIFGIQEIFADITVVFIQHLLTDFEATIDAFVRAGLKPANAFIMGIPYSTKENVHTRLQGTFGYVPREFDGYPFDAQLPPILDQVYEHCRSRGQQFLVVEDGGYIAARFRRDPNGPKWASLCIGIVEQTRNGIRVTQDWIKSPEPTDNPINVAVVNVAETELKLRLESPLIGQAVVFNLKRLLSFYEEQTLSGRRVLLIGGCGATGSQILRELVREGCLVTVVDLRAPPDNFPSEATYRSISELLSLIRGQDIIIGSTGNAMGYPEKDSVAPLSDERYFAQLQDRAVLVNASSKRAEFNLDALKTLGTKAVKRGFGHEYILDKNRVVRVAADGFPINFFNSESVPSYDIQPVLGMLFVAAYRLAESGRPTPGILEFGVDDQQMIEGLYQQLKNDDP
jgi:S-adenosylhomocysteine hydrolase